MAEHAYLDTCTKLTQKQNTNSNQFCPAPRQMNPLLSAFYLNGVTNAHELAYSLAE